ncbi:DEAD/DEAH box helicase family protein [Thermodesulfovibrio sp. 1176]|uniref:DEAD/DEAH box helicase n=1 Tax=Thermodesulfovibrio sp. 1176 TaxID=3043424 RepID=UPI0024832C15|nr:DEAD/DEAH box helicase family protein [Thermodesulfovibrio sp. 1176]MDI1472993.1 DEAD/DEAH box helicase family protein [Thermodesulfovibrio sp. 1176]
MIEIKTYKTKDLVLEVSKSYDPTKLDLSIWDRFIDVLCGDRQYQKEAIENAIVYLASGRYKSIEDLVEENWEKNPELHTRYRSLDEYFHHIQLPHKLSATIDLATGTGKSYVIYGIAQMMLGLGLVDKVLVLCPSLTIEKGLMEKFISLSGDSKLKQTLPLDAVFKNPRIIDANSTIKDGDICIENIHAVYEKTGSSIKDSLMGNGERVLVLNDEVHHAYNKVSGRDKESQSIKKWKDFLLSSDYNFKYMLGFTGTAYIEDEYFNDVIYRYSLRQAVDDKVVKMVDYVSKDESIDQYEKFQKIYDNHVENQNKYRRIKPLTILITKDITNAKRLTENLKEFLSTKEGLPIEEIEKKVLIVTSAQEHKANVARLKDVDSKEDPTEWIVSVSMLTEGWDVKNVFQIVPWEDRAFNSKLLIAQVLGRGLRIPPEYQSPQPRVKVFNHDAWSRSIKGLVDEIFEIEMKLVSSVLKEGERAKYNFTLYNINYDKEPQEKEAEKETEVFDYTKGYIELISQVEDIEKGTEYTSLAGEIYSKNTLIEYNTYTVDEIVNKIYEEFKTRDWEGRILQLPDGEYTKNNLPPKDIIKSIIRKSMDRRGIKGDRLVEKNRQRILQAFGTLLRKKGKTVVNVRKVSEPIPINTDSMDRESLAVGNLRHGATVFYTDNFENEISGEVKDILIEVKKDESLPKSAEKEINQFLFKTPLDLVLTKGEPERKFVEQLVKRENAEKIDAWIKSRDQGFYSIEYSWRKGEHPQKNQFFNPDFFIKIKKEDTEHIIVVEVKTDGDDSIENKAKLRWAKQHFSDLNKELENADIRQKYIFHFLSPISYEEFFQYLRDGRLIAGMFRSDIEDKFERNGQNE